MPNSIRVRVGLKAHGVWLVETVNKLFQAAMHVLMKRHGLTQIEVSKALKVPRGTTSRWCSGESLPRPKNWDGLARLFGVHPSAFLDPIYLEEFERDRVEAITKQAGALGFKLVKEKTRNKK